MKTFAAFAVALSFVAAAAAHATVATPGFMDRADTSEISNNPVDTDKAKPTYCQNHPHDTDRC